MRVVAVTTAANGRATENDDAGALTPEPALTTTDWPPAPGDAPTKKPNERCRVSDVGCDSDCDTAYPSPARLMSARPAATRAASEGHTGGDGGGGSAGGAGGRTGGEGGGLGRGGGGGA